MKTIQEFIQANGITLKSVLLAERPDGNDSDWDKKAFHYMVTLLRHEVSAEGVLQDHRPALGSMSTPYSKGSGHVYPESANFMLRGKPIPPKADEVLDSLAVDCSGELSNFEDWCSDYGYDTDSRKAEATFKACQSISNRLMKFLGKELYIELLGKVERL